MNNSRVNKYRDLRAGLKDEAGINRENIEEVIDSTNDIEDDDFLARINRAFKDDEKEIHDINDTLTEAKTFEQMRQESSEEVNRALRSAKVSVGKEAQYNTRMDILNKIREPEKQVIHIDNFENVNTSEFSKGYFVNKEEPVDPKVEAEKEAKKKMTLMERLASMSPEEDVKKAKLVMEEAKEEPEQVVEDLTNEETVCAEEAVKIEQTRSLEEMLRQIKEKDQREVEKVLKQKEETANLKMIKKSVDDQTNDSKLEVEKSRSEITEENKSDRIANILNYIIIFLVVVFIGLCAMIGYQLFF